MPTHARLLMPKPETQPRCPRCEPRADLLAPAQVRFQLQSRLTLSSRPTLRFHLTSTLFSQRPECTSQNINQGALPLRTLSYCVRSPASPRPPGREEAQATRGAHVQGDATRRGRPGTGAPDNSPSGSCTLSHPRQAQTYEQRDFKVMPTLSHRSLLS